jgi:hypothetical protein
MAWSSWHRTAVFPRTQRLLRARETRRDWPCFEHTDRTATVPGPAVRHRHRKAPEPLRHTHSNPGDDHSAITVAYKDNLHEVLPGYQRTDLTDMISQVMVMFICQRRSKRMMAMRLKERDDPVPVRRVQLAAGRVIVPSGEPVPRIRGHVASVDEDEGCHCYPDFRFSLKRPAAVPGIHRLPCHRHRRPVHFSPARPLAQFRQA